MIQRLIFKNEAGARDAMKRAGVDPAGIEIMAGKFLHVVCLARDLTSPACNILKQEMLSIGGEAAVARGTVNMSVKNSDAIIGGTRVQIERLASKLSGQPFGLSKLSEELRIAANPVVPSPIAWQGHRFDFSASPILMGILNVTPDSFSDGGKFFDPGPAVEHALQMENEGAGIVDIGGESTRPGAVAIDHEEELRRVIPVIKLLAGRLKIPISIDTRNSATARAAIDAGASMVNDISGLRGDGEMARLVAERGVPVVVMHMRGTPRTMQSGTIEYDDLMGEITSFLLESAGIAENAGVDPGFVIIDPGIGFGKTMIHNLSIISGLPELVSLGRPVLIGPSNKAFIGTITGKPPSERDRGTAAAVAACTAGGAHIIRVHDVAWMKDVVSVARAIRDA